MHNLWVNKSVNYKDLIDHEKHDVYGLGITLI